MWLLVLFVALAVIYRTWTILPARVSGRAKKATNASLQTTYRTLVVLGSGGHTTEMLKLIKRLNVDKYAPLAFVVAATDHTSREKAKAERKEDELKFFEIPRSREVGQSWLTTIFTTAKAFLHSMAIVLNYQPDLLLCNGPGTCIPLCAAVFLLRFVGIKMHSKIIFCESFARVTHLSLSGKILYHFVDEFIVHWPQLQRAYPNTKYLGVLC